jgi:hypothetical protein
MKAVTGGAPVADHKRKAIAGRTPYSDVLNGAVKLQRHLQTVHLWRSLNFSSLQ